MSVISSNSQSFAQFTVDNIMIDGNTISSTDANGDITISPNGTGTVVIDTDIDFDNININGNTISSTDTNGNVIIAPDGTGNVVIDQNGEGIALSIDSEQTTTDIIDIQANTITTGNVIDVAAASALTTGSVINIVSAGTTRTSGALVDVSATGDSAGANTGGIMLLTQDDADTGTRSVLSVIQENAAASGAVGFTVRQDAAAAAIAIDQNGENISLSIDSEQTTTDIIDIQANTVTTGNIIDVAAAGALTTGSILNLVSDSADTSARVLVQITNDNAAATLAVPLDINNDADSISFNLVTDATTEAAVAVASDAMTTGDVITITSDALITGSVIAATCTSTARTGSALFDLSHVGNSGGANTGGIMLLTENDSDTGARSVLEVIQEHASATGNVGITVRQDSTAKGVFINQDGVGIALDIDTESTTADGINVQADAITTGVIARLASDSADATARNLLEVINDNTAAVGAVPIMVQQDAVTSTNFKKCIEIAGFTIWISDGTTAEGALTGVEGDLCLNGGTGSGQLAYCDSNGTNWTDM